MKTSITRRTLIVPVLCLLAGAFFARALPAAESSPPQHGGALTVIDVLDRIDRFGRIEADSAVLVRQGVEGMNHPAARLELALLEIYGPEPVRDRKRGLEMLEQLAGNLQPGIIPEETHRLLQVLVGHVRELVDLAAERSLATARLEQERRAHLNTLEKLDGLRQIEQDLEAQKEHNSERNSEDERHPIE